MLDRINTPAAITILMTILMAIALWVMMIMMMGLGFSDTGMNMQMPAGWSVGLVIGTAIMWLLMMLAMMLPSMVPMLAIYATLSAKEDSGLRLAIRITSFGAGYFGLWAIFSIAMSILQLVLRDTPGFTEYGTQATPMIAGILMIIAGLYQMTAIKNKCLLHCQRPIVYLMSHWRGGLRGAFPLGFHHGLFCVGCCWVFMGLMFVFGSMTVWWMAVLAIYFVAEKILPRADVWSKAVGVLLIIAGVMTLVI